MAIPNINENTNFYEGYELALKNAYAHIEVAKSCENISIGISNSHLILSAEEAVKAELLFLLDFDKDYQDEVVDFDEYFRNHKHKHGIIKYMEFIGLTTEKMFQIILNPFVGIEQGSLSKEEIINKRNEGFDNLIEWLNNVVDDKEIHDTNQEWWNQADANKNKGFYVSLLKKSGKWEGPFSITQNQYEKSKKIVTAFVDKVGKMKQLFQHPEISNLYNRMKNKKNR